ncbi:MAG: TFIIB-type zinc ribbon-containing protein [Clostridiales bacterium]|nr:TFIIB-type zinc ribbon-containing protein [Clostridiales bacterium]
MSDVRMCPFCSREMEHDSLTGRFVCPECGRSESAQNGIDLSIAVPKSSTIKSVSSPSVDASITSLSEKQGKRNSRTPSAKRSYTDAIIPVNNDGESLAKENTQSKENDPEKRRAQNTSRELERHALPRSSVTKDDAYSILRTYFRAFECNSLEEVMVHAEESGSDEYLDKISTHPALSSFQEVLPKSRIPQNIRAFCHKVRQLSEAEVKLRKSQEDLKKTEEYVEKLKEKQKRFSFGRNKIDTSIILAMLFAPLTILLIGFFGERDDGYGYIESKADLNLVMKATGILYLIVFAILAIRWIYSLIRNRPKKGGAKLIDIKKSQVDSMFSVIYKLHEEKEELLKSIRTEEESVRVKCTKKRERF